ncbi:MAG: hypothetical protein CM15mP58_02320 [Burkholderiaceae bacterium]|nr:MAG: hypothetical protein CM15mP58_02320 [Burkholderiaceae bacterium]
MKEGSLEAPTRHAVDWKSESFTMKKLVSMRWNAFLTSAMDAGDV